MCLRDVVLNISTGTKAVYRLPLCFTLPTNSVPSRQSELTAILFTVKQFGPMLLFNFELKYTCMCNTAQVTSFMFGAPLLKLHDKSLGCAGRRASETEGGCECVD